MSTGRLHVRSRLLGSDDPLGGHVHNPTGTWHGAKRSFEQNGHLRSASDGLKFHLPSAGKRKTDDESSQYGGTRNQDLGRKINNRIRRRGPWQGNKICVVCECVDCDCEERIQMTVEQYQQIRKEGSVFLVVVGHQSPNVERIVGGEGKWLAIQKTGRGKRYAEKLDTP